MSATSADVLIVGLGPAGASAALAACRAGARVVAIDRKRTAGLPVQCAELVPAAFAQDCAALGAAFSQSVSRMRTFVEDAPPDSSDAFPGYMLERGCFDGCLIDAARAAGADCRSGQSVARIEADGTVETSAGSVLRARVVIGADGPLSTVGRMMGVRNRDFVWARQLTVALHAPHDATDIFLSSSFPGGYGWLFPKRNVANLGVGVTAGTRPRLKALLAALYFRLREEGRVGAVSGPPTGGMIPVGGMLPGSLRRTDRLFLLSGDAAGLTNPVTGAGIHAALVSGRLAGMAAAAFAQGDRRAGEDYAEELHDIFAASLARALKRRRELWQFHRTPAPAALRAGWVAYPQYWQAQSRGALQEIPA